jgi:hypothetical protein
MDLISPQYHIIKASKSSRHVTIFVGCYEVIVGLIFTLGTLAQVGAHPKEIENTPREPLDVLLLG